MCDMQEESISRRVCGMVLLLNGYKTRERPTSERVQLDGP